MAIITYKKNYKGRKKIPRSGHRGNMIFQPYGNMTIVREMPKHYRDANSEAQQPCRNKMKWVMMMHKHLKTAYRGCFEGKKSDYHQFRSMNLNSEIGRCIVSHGTLPTLNTRIVDGRAEFDMKEEEWKKGDVLRFVSLTGGDDGCERCNSVDMVISKPKTEIVKSETLQKGWHCYIHIRPTRDGNKVSSQEMCEVRGERRTDNGHSGD